jgi:predicted nuclease with TOPRIM domain
MEEITRLRNDNSTHIKIIFSLQGTSPPHQEHLKKAELEKVQLEELIITLRGEIDALQQKFILIKSDNDLSVLESALGILKKRYANCQD